MSSHIAATLSDADRRLIDNLEAHAQVLRAELARTDAPKTELALTELIERMFRRRPSLGKRGSNWPDRSKLCPRSVHAECIARPLANGAQSLAEAVAISRCEHSGTVD